MENFLESYIQLINNNRNQEFEKFNYKYDEKIIKEKLLQENTIEYKKYSSNIKKTGLINKNKPGNIKKKNYDECGSSIDILNDDIFHNNEVSDNKKSINFDEITIDEKENLINNFIESKNIKFDENNLEKLKNILNDQDINLKKYISISKMYQNIVKISFIKKLEDGSYIIDLNNNKTKKTKNIFFK